MSTEGPLLMLLRRLRECSALDDWRCRSVMLDGVEVGDRCRSIWLDGEQPVMLALYVQREHEPLGNYLVNEHGELVVELHVGAISVDGLRRERPSCA